MQDRTEMLSGFHKPLLAMTTDRDRLTRQECQAWHRDHVENTGTHATAHTKTPQKCSHTRSKNRQTGVDGYNARTISRPIKTIKTDRDFETNCPTHFLHTHMPRKCVRMCNAQSQLGQFGSRTHRNCCCPQANLTGNTLPDYNTATHSHTKSFSHIHNTQNSTSTPHKYKLRLMPSNTL